MLNTSLTVALAAVLSAPIGGPEADTESTTDIAGEPPNIVVIYLDDVSPHDGRLWNSRSRTPAIYDHFIAQGIRFTNAIAENPLCCPARANLLTGLHTHNNHVGGNNGHRFDPSVHIGRRLRGAGYASMYIGKYLNRANSFTNTEWKAHSAGWSYFDVLNEINGKYYNYSLFTKTGTVAYDSDPSDHSTQMVADRAVRRFRQVSADQPIFAVLSVYDLHTPNAVMPRFKGAARCAAMPPWNPPSYNEADVSDKPAYVRNRDLRPYPDGWPMVRYCQEMLGVDWLVKAVTDELAAQGRLNNTLLVFTADNGIGWGEHRLPKKRSPYATRVPLYMTWPARWGPKARIVTEHTTNIDLAPTFCAVGGCQMGPYPEGQATADGLNLMPLLNRKVSKLGRDAILERGRAANGRIPWTALRTTAIHPAGLWHYVEYRTGERELYDLAADPWELENRAGRAATVALQASLATRLAQLRNEGRVGSGSIQCLAAYTPCDFEVESVSTPAGESLNSTR